MNNYKSASKVSQKTTTSAGNAIQSTKAFRAPTCFIVKSAIYAILANRNSIFTVISASFASKEIKIIHSIVICASLAVLAKKKTAITVKSVCAASLKISLSTVTLAFYVFKLNTNTGI